MTTTPSGHSATNAQGQLPQRDVQDGSLTRINGLKNLSINSCTEQFHSPQPTKAVQNQDEAQRGYHMPNAAIKVSLVVS